MINRTQYIINSLKSVISTSRPEWQCHQLHDPEGDKLSSNFGLHSHLYEAHLGLPSHQCTLAPLHLYDAHLGPPSIAVPVQSPSSPTQQAQCYAHLTT